MKDKNAAAFLVYTARTVDPVAETQIIIPTGDEFHILEILKTLLPMGIRSERFALVYLNCEGAITTAQVAELKRARGVAVAGEAQ